MDRFPNDLTIVGFLPWKSWTLYWPNFSFGVVKVSIYSRRNAWSNPNMVRCDPNRIHIAISLICEWICNCIFVPNRKTILNMISVCVCFYFFLFFLIKASLIWPSLTNIPFVIKHLFSVVKWQLVSFMVPLLSQTRTTLNVRNDKGKETPWAIWPMRLYLSRLSISGF